MITTLIKKVEPEANTWEIKNLFSAIIQLENNREASLFFRDLCTIKEIKEMARRWQVVKLLRENLPYLEIAKRTGASTATITRVAHWLHYGMGGYQKMLKHFGHRPEKVR